MKVKRNIIQNVMNSVLATAVIVLFVLFFTVGQKGNSCSCTSEMVASSEEQREVVVNGDTLLIAPESTASNQAHCILPIAAVSTDSILLHYQLAIEANDRLQSQYEESVLKLDKKAKSLQKEAETFQQDYINFQKKVEAGAFMSRERAESEAAKLEKKQQQLMNKQQELENLRQQLSAEFMQNQAALAQQLQDSVQAYLNEYNADGHLHLILNDAVLMNKVGGYDITNEVIEALNARYKK